MSDIPAQWNLWLPKRPQCGRPSPEGSAAGKGQIRGLVSRAEIEPLRRVPLEEPCSSWQYANVAAINTSFSLRMSEAMSRDQCSSKVLISVPPVQSTHSMRPVGADSTSSNGAGVRAA
jgi:hypothetical protein